ncbi:MAG: hypothetical protein HY308_01230 [Gammaproteobacteria bacterium]|nr:hypothetical protein [Gammaproteobacteria bacterium]
MQITKETLLSTGCSALLFFSITATAAEESQAKDVARPTKSPATMQGIKLTPQQAEDLKKLREENRVHLSTEQVFKTLGLNETATTPDDTAGTLSSGKGESVGDCSTMQLWGDDSGNYTFEQWLVPGQSALFGEISIYTDGLIPSDVHTYPLTGSYQQFYGRLGFVPWGASQTVAGGWMLTDSSWLCSGTVTADWH